MADAAGGGEDTLVSIRPGPCIMRYASENEREADIRHGKIEIDGISVEKSFLRFDTKEEARHVHENLSKLEGDSFLKSCLIISHRGYWLAVDRFDCSLKRYCDKHPVCWNKSEVQLDPKDELSDTNQKEVIIRYQLEPTYRQIVRPSLAKLFFHPLLRTPMQRFHLPVAMRTLTSYHLPKSQWLENCPGGAKWKENVRGDYKEILSYRQNNTQDQTEYIDDARGQLKFVRNTIVHFNDPQGKKVENATSSGGSNRPKKTAEEVEQELSVMLPSSFTNVYNLFNVKALASTSVHLREEKIQL